ncbi:MULTISPECIES: glycosyltransferase [unclassified Microbacterium]|uniref:glycosyltransferase n=1 Tax=unclassified Microbacterium TaxID=2609290 RepID=UPI003C2F4AE1
MTTTLRVVFDPSAPGTGPDLATAARELAAALVTTAPSGCEVRAIVPGDAGDDTLAAQGVAAADRLPVGSSAAAALWRRGLRAGAGDGLIHSATLAAPLVRHDRVHDHDQTVVTLWDVRPWDHPDEVSRADAAWARAMLRRAVRHADAVVVPTHELAHRVAELAPLGDRIRVIAGAPESALRVPSDEIGRRRDLGLPEGYVLLSGSSAASDRLRTGFEAVATSGRDTAVVVIDAPDGQEPAIAELAAAAGLPERRVHVRGHLEAPDRAAVLAGAVALLAPSDGTAFPWRTLDALRLGVPIVAADSATHRELLLDGATFAPGDAESLGDELAATLASTSAVERLAVLSADRGRAFSWAGAAERVWQLHAEL